MVILIFSSFSLLLNKGSEFLRIEKESLSYTYTYEDYSFEGYAEREEVVNPGGFGIRANYTKNFVGAGFGFTYFAEDYNVTGSVKANLPPPIPSSYSLQESLPYRHASISLGFTADMVPTQFFFFMFMLHISYNWIIPVATKDYIEEKILKEVEDILKGDLSIEIPAPELEERWGVFISMGTGGRINLRVVNLRVGAGLEIMRLFSPSSVFSGTARLKLIMGIDI